MGNNSQKTAGFYFNQSSQQVISLRLISTWMTGNQWNQQVEFWICTLSALRGTWLSVPGGYTHLALQPLNVRWLKIDGRNATSEQPVTHTCKPSCAGSHSSKNHRVHILWTSVHTWAMRFGECLLNPSHPENLNWFKLLNLSKCKLELNVVATVLQYSLGVAPKIYMNTLLYRKLRFFSEL